MPASNDRLSRFGFLALVALAVVVASPAAAQQGPRTYRMFPYLIPAGDLTGNGLADTLTNETTYEEQVEGVASFFPTDSTSARRGIDGSALWEREIRADLLLPAPLGQEAEPGVLVVDGAYTGSAGGGGGSIEFIGSFGEGAQLRNLTLTALDGDGGVLWERLFDAGAFGGVVFANPQDGRRQVVAARQYPLFVELIQATPSPAMDALVTILDRTEVDDQIETTLNLVVVDGANGNLASQSLLVNTGTRPRPLAAGDLDGDGLADLLVARYPDAGSLTAFSGAEGLGKTLWTNDDITVPFEVFAENLGDVTGDGIEDVAIRGYGDVYDTDPPRVSVLDGGSGAVLFEEEADTISAVGPVGGGKIGLLTQSYDAAGSAVVYRVFDASGAILSERTVSVPEDDEDTYLSFTPVAGDLDEDGALDAGHVFVRTDGQGGTTTEDRTVLSGRTLEILLDGDAGIPFLASLDGAGDDLVRVERSSQDAFRIVGQAGSGDELWAQTLAADPVFPRMGRISVSPADVDGDQVPDVILNIEASRLVETTGGGSSSEFVRQAWVLRGTDGSTLWSV